MDNRSRSKRNLPKGFPFTGEVENLRGRESIHPTQVVTPGREHENLFGNLPITTKRCSFMICEAYSEPQGFDIIEQLILQRNYIID